MRLLYQRKSYRTSKNLSGKIFNYLKVIEKTEERTSKGGVKWKCQCLNCGNYVLVEAHSLISGHTKSCGCIKSMGEKRISELLNKYNFSFKTQKTFNTCVFTDSLNKAQFDFYLSDFNYLIEYDGEQHFKYTDSGWNTKEKFIKTQEHDAYKNQWCKENNIPLIRIPYTHLKDLCIEDLLLETTEYRVV